MNAQKDDALELNTATGITTTRGFSLLRLQANLISIDAFLIGLNKQCKTNKLKNGFGLGFFFFKSLQSSVVVENEAIKLLKIFKATNNMTVSLVKTELWTRFPCKDGIWL